MRFKDVLEHEMTEPQRAFCQEYYARRPGHKMAAPTRALLRCPELAVRAKKLQEHLLSGTSLPERIKEFAILITARFWDAKYEWYSHVKKAIAGGLSVEVASALAEGKTPPGMDVAETAAFRFCSELHEKRNVQDATFDAAVAQFGDHGVVELIAISGHYTLISMLLNVNQTPIPEGKSGLPQLK